MSVNKVILLGNLGADPETKYGTNGKAITRIRVATSVRYKDANNNPVEKTEWHRVVFFGKPAENAGKYLKKGGSVYIEGRLSTSEWNDANGNKRYTTEIVVDQFQMLGSKSGGTAPLDDAASSGSAYDDMPSGFNDFDKGTGGFDGLNEDDDIPF